MNKRSLQTDTLNKRSLKLGAAAIVAGLALFAACGDSKKSARPVDGAAGQGGEAGGEAGDDAQVIEPVRCGFATCRPIGDVPPCCANPLEGICGVELGMGASEPTSELTCQPVTQPGKLDPGCPASTGGVVGGLPLPAFPGCCREATGQCGYLVTDLAGLLPFAPGCIDATPFLGGEEPEACGPGANEGGAPGTGGTPGIGGSPVTGGSPGVEAGAPSGGTANGEAGSGGHGGVPGAAGEAGAPVVTGLAGEGGLGGNGSVP